LSTYGFTFHITPETSPQNLAEYLHEKYGIDLSQRKIKHLRDHQWLQKSWGVIPWGFFQAKRQRSWGLYEDESVLIVCKPPFMTVVGPKETSPLVDIWQQKQNYKLYAVHRLDYETSGIVVFSKNKNSKVALDELFRQQKIQKRYGAWVYGKPSQSQWDCTTPLQQRGGMMIAASPLTPANQTLKARTIFRCIKTVGDEQQKQITWIEAKPVTGKRHQIRAHLYLQGHPVIGESLYGGADPKRSSGVRCQLHALSLSFNLKGKSISVSCHPPSDMMPTDMLGWTS
jgi:tRNA pseudouridine32 synthase / 23S rRNA pseudouridine746 synthase